MKTSLYRDHCLIIVGPGGEADAVLAQRRLAAGGRLCHIRTRGASDPRVKVRGFQEDEHVFVWYPPGPSRPPTSMGRRLGAGPHRYWTKLGPDCTELQANETLDISSTGGCLRHICIYDSRSLVQVEMSGLVVLNPSMDFAKSCDVEVVDQDLKPFGAISWRWAFLGALCQICWYSVRLVLSILLERSAQEGAGPEQVLWLRTGLVAITGAFMLSDILSEMWGMSLAGERPTVLAKCIGKAGCACAFLVVGMFQLADLYCALAACFGLLGTGPWFLVYQTRGKHPRRSLWTCFLWTLASVSLTCMLATLATFCGLAHSLLAETQMQLLGSVFLPVSTGLVEFVGVACARMSYDKIVRPGRRRGVEQVPGDQLYTTAVINIMAAHAFTECARLTANFSNAVITGSYAWVGTLALACLLNVGGRLGWIRFFAFHAIKYLVGCRLAAKVVAPNSWTKLHDDIKVHAGYFRFVGVGAVVLARALVFQGQKSPVFNTSATIALVCSRLAEMLEDFIVLKELLPMSPLPVEFMDAHQVRLHSNTEPTKFFTTEFTVSEELAEEQDHWRPSELSHNGSRKRTVDVLSALPVAMTRQTLKCRVALGDRDGSTWGRLRMSLGQPRKVAPSPQLYGLRELPFMLVMTGIGATAEVTCTLLAVFLGAGYIRGIYDEPCTGQHKGAAMLFWDIPLRC